MTFLRLGVDAPSGPWEECLVAIRGLMTCWTECDFKAGSALHAVLVTAVDIMDSETFQPGVLRCEVVAVFEQARAM